MVTVMGLIVLHPSFQRLLPCPTSYPTPSFRSSNAPAAPPLSLAQLSPVSRILSNLTILQLCYWLSVVTLLKKPLKYALLSYQASHLHC